MCGTTRATASRTPPANLGGSTEAPDVDAITLQGLHRERFLGLVLTTLLLYRVLTHLDHHLPSYLLYEG